MPFQTIHHINDIQEKVAHKKEIRFSKQANGTTIVSYNISDSSTFDTPEALECRGLTFSKEGTVVSRPLHKFFNLGEKDDLRQDTLIKRQDIVAVFDKLDGSMICTANVDGELSFKSKKSFDSYVAKLANSFLQLETSKNYISFCAQCMHQNWTAIFEFQHPAARIVVAVTEPTLTLLHVRNNLTGEYILLDANSVIHQWIKNWNIPLIKNHKESFIDTQAVLDSLLDMKNAEGYVIQFADGNMVKIKCPWYTRLHRCVTFLRERDIARISLHNELDDIKEALIESGIDLAPVLAVETRVKQRIIDIMDSVDSTVASGSELSTKDFAIQNKNDPYFGLLMAKKNGKDPDYVTFFEKVYLKNEFSLALLADTTTT